MMKQRPQFDWATSKSARHKTLRERFDIIYQWFFTGTARHARDVKKFPGDASPYAPCHMESLIDKFTNEYIFLYSLFNVRDA